MVYGDLATNHASPSHLYGFSDPGQIRPKRSSAFPDFRSSWLPVLPCCRHRPVTPASSPCRYDSRPWLSCCLLAALARRLMGRTRSGDGRTLAQRAVPIHLQTMSAAPLTETPAVFCVALAFFSLWIAGRQSESKPGAHGTGCRHPAWRGALHGLSFCGPTGHCSQSPRRACDALLCASGDSREPGKVHLRCLPDRSAVCLHDRRAACRMDHS